jgi:hypothetical protein
MPVEDSECPTEIWGYYLEEEEAILTAPWAQCYQPRTFCRDLWDPIFSEIKIKNILL